DIRAVFLNIHANRWSIQLKKSSTNLPALIFVSVMNRVFEQGEALIHDLRTCCVLRRSVAIDKLDWRVASSGERSHSREDLENDDSTRVQYRSVSMDGSE